MSAVRGLSAAFLAAALITAATAARADDPVVFAAASLTNAFDAAVAACKPTVGAGAKTSYAGSLALAKQIEQGAPADLFASADEESMDYAAQRHLIKDDTRVDLLANSLVVVAAKTSSITNLPLTKDALTKAIGSGRVATGEVSSVPVGKYAKTALTKLGLWDTVEPHLAMSDNVRAALAFVTRGEAPLGIVYSTDAKSEPGVKIVATFPADSHPAINYPFALTAASKNEAAAKLLACLKSPTAAPSFEGQGFVLLGSKK